MYKHFEIKTTNSLDSFCKKFIIKHHYKKTIARSCFMNYLLFVDNELVGIAQYGTPNSRTYNNKRIIELKRFTLSPNCVKNTASWFMSRCHKLIRDSNNFDTIISYCENDRHTGCIYKASNFVSKKISRKGQSIMYEGRQLHLRQCYQKRGGEYTKPAKLIQSALKNGEAKYISLGTKTLFSYKLMK